MPKTLSATVAANVRAELARRRVPQGQVAEALTLSQASVSRRLAGETPFELDELTTVAEILGLTVGDLIEATAA